MSLVNPCDWPFLPLSPPSPLPPVRYFKLPFPSKVDLLAFFDVPTNCPSPDAFRDPAFLLKALFP